jgi:hypothetical protein
MNKLLCENPRHGSRWKSYKEVRTREYDVSEDGPTRQKMKKPYGYNNKSLNENLNPLWNFLESSLGKNWDSVYSEIRKNLRVDRAIDLHIMQHLDHMVYKNVRMIDGKAHILGYNGWQEVTYGFYVDPSSGKLLKATGKTYNQQMRERREKARQEELAVRRVVVPGKVEMRKKDGIWYWCDVAQPPKDEKYWVLFPWMKRGEWRIKSGVRTCPILGKEIAYPNYYVTKYRQANKKEIKEWVK